MPARALLANLSTRGKIVLAAGALAVVIVLFVLFRIATAPSYTTLMSGMEPKETGDVTAALDQRGIPWELQNNGTAVAVPRGDTARARIALAESGISAATGTKKGYEILDKQKMGTSNFQQQVNYQRAKEGEIANTISEIDGVGDAQVQLVLPDPEAQLFSDSVSPATAAVLLSGTSMLDEGQVRGIAQLVANSVPGLRTEKVTITDGTGTPLWPTATSGGSGGLLAKQAAEARYNQMAASTISAMLARTVGPDKVQVQVKADLDANEATQDRLVYGRDGTPLVRREERETLDGRGGGAGGPAGTAGNIPGYARTGDSQQRYERTGEDETLGVNKTRTTTRIAPGRVLRQQVAVLVDDSIPAATLPAIRDAVMSAAGIDEERGDRLTLGQMAFVEPARPAASSPVDDIWDYARYALLGMAALLFLALVARQLRKRENEALAGEPTWLREIESPRTLAELERFEEPVAPTRVLPLRSPENPARMQVEELVERDPERVAQHVRAWIQED